MSNEQNDSNDELHGDPRILDQYSHSANTVGNERVPSSASHDIIEESVRFTSLSSDETPSAGETEHVLSSDTSTTINPVGGELNPTVFFQSYNNRYAMWRARRNEKESEESRRVRLENESGAKSSCREIRNQTESIAERQSRLAQKAAIKTSQRGIQQSNESDELREERLHDQATRKKLCRDIRSLQESDDDRDARMQRDTLGQRSKRSDRDLQETEDERNARLQREAFDQESRRSDRDMRETEDDRDARLQREGSDQESRRTQRVLQETEHDRDTRLQRDTFGRRSRRSDRDLQETQDDRDARLQREAIDQESRRTQRDLQETEDDRDARLQRDTFGRRSRRSDRDLRENEDDREARLQRDASDQESRRTQRDLQETEDDRNARLQREASDQISRRTQRDLQETEDDREARLQREAFDQESRRSDRDMRETDCDRIERLEHDALDHAIRRVDRAVEETEEIRDRRLRSERESKRFQRLPDISCDNTTLQNQSTISLQTEVNSQCYIQQLPEHDPGRHTPIEPAATVQWPKIATAEIKHGCLIAFKEAMSNRAVEQVTCVVCACLHYTRQSVLINIGCLLNKHLLHPIDDIPAGVMRLQMNIDPQTDYVQMNEHTRNSLLNSKDSTAIINGMLLCWKGIDLSNGFAQICEKCHRDLIDAKLPALSLCNLMWLGDVPLELQDLTLSEQKLIALYRHSNCIIKLFSVTRNPCLAQTALKGNVITFPQNVSEIARSLPLSPSSLPDLIKVIFVGQTLPTREQLRSILTVRRDVVRQALLWLHANNILYRDVAIDHLMVNTLPINDIPDSLWDTMAKVDQLESNNVERSGYVEDDLIPEETCANGPIPLAPSGLIDTHSVTTSSGDIVRHLMGRMNMADEVRPEDDRIYLVPRGQRPVNEYFNTSFLPGLYPTLFPYGRGGVENQNRLGSVSYAKHLRYFLTYHDRRFEMNNSFIFVNFNILQRRAACAKARLLVSRPFFTTQAMEINQITAAEVKTVLSQIESNQLNAEGNRRISTLRKQIKTVAGGVMGSNQSRANCRVELHAQIFSFGLPNIFITINPCDLHHPLAMKFAGVNLDIDHLLSETMPSSQERAALVVTHPVAIGRFFNKLIETVLKTLIGYNHQQHRPNPDGGVLGTIDGYYGTVEESGRGALHLHMLLWLAENMSPNDVRESIKNATFRSNLINYLEDIIKEDLSFFQTEQYQSDPSQTDRQNRTLNSICSPIPMPNEADFESKKELTVCTLVSECQIHRHTSTCYKYAHKTSTNEPSCRMRYPKEMHDSTMIDTETGEIRMRRAHPMVNNFNEWLLLACRCNMDIKFIWSGADTKALVYYITDYITKRNLSFHDTHVLIYRAVDSFAKQEHNREHLDAVDRSRRLILRCFNTIASQQEISSVQVASYLMGWPDHYCSHTFVNVYLIGIERYLENSLNKSRHQSMEMTNDLAASNHVELSTMECSHAEEGDNDEGESFELETGFDDEHFVLCNKRVDYQLRSPVLQHISLYFFFAEYRKAKMTLHDKTLLGLLDQSTTGIPRGRPPNDRWLFHCDHPQYSTHITIRRSFAVIPVLVGPAIPRCDREDTAQRYARAILTLFHPWTTVLDLCHLNQSWIEALTVLQTTFSTQSNRVISNIQLLHECKRDRDNDLFQLVNKSTTVTNETSFFEPYLATGVGDVEEILTLLDTSIDPNSSFANQNVNEFNSAQARIKSEYLDSTIANVIRSGRFSHIPTNESLSELMSNNPHVFSNRTTANELIVRKASESDVQQNRAWQHALKTQKERMRQILLFGLTDEQMTNQQADEIALVRQVNHDDMEGVNDDRYQQLVSPGSLQPKPIETLPMPDFVEKFSLNTEQTKTFLIVKSHMEHTFAHETNHESNRTKPEQLLMYIGGAGGCGKSRVIEAVSDHMRHYGRLQRLRKLAPSSAAAVGIDGLTIQSMLHEGRNKSSGQSEFKQADLSAIEAEWRSIDYCLIDEISMVGCYMLARIHKITTIAKHTSPTVPFGGVNMIFLGDFIQYAPVLDRPLYSNLLLSNETLSNTISDRPSGLRMMSERDIQCKVGRALWLQVNKVVFLSQQMRNKDRKFMDLQARLRGGECNDDDYNVLMSRVVRCGNQIESLREAPWNSATMVVFRNEVRTKINNLSVFDHAIRFNQSPVVIVAIDQVRCQHIDNVDIRKFLLSLPDNKTEGLPGYLPIVPNMPVVITHNVATELHISNGSIGRLVSLVYEDEERSGDPTAIANPTFPWNTIYIRQPLYALVELPQCKLASHLPDLRPTIVPIVPEVKQIKVDLKSCLSPAQKRLLQNKTNITITRCQFPIVPAYSMTTHKCQGKTLTCGVIDIVPPPYAKPDLAQTYVPISRFTSLETMAILRPFPRSVLNQKPHPDMIAELKRLELLDQLGRTFR